jgi:hypothetical protein
MTYKKRTGLTQLILGPFDFGAPWRGGSFPGGLKTGLEFGHFLVRVKPPEGRKQNSPGLQAWEAVPRRFALKGRPTARRYYQR